MKLASQCIMGYTGKHMPYPTIPNLVRGIFENYSLLSHSKYEEHSSISFLAKMHRT